MLARPRALEEVTGPKDLAVCPVCGAAFNPARYQVMVDGTGVFDRVDCADTASSQPRRREDELARRRRMRG
jgi:hypothetical protein